MTASSLFTVESVSSASSRHSSQSFLSPTPFEWPEPNTIAPRRWLYGAHLMRGIVSLTVAPGGVGKSSLVILQALELATGKSVLGHRIGDAVRVWLMNLEDDMNELTRRVVAAMMHHGIDASDLDDNLYLDSGLDRPLVLASENRDTLLLNNAVFEHLEEVIRREKIDVVIIDPFVSAHEVNEADNGKIDRIAKRLSRLSMECGCAIELVHHTRKLNGMAVSSEAGRGASSLLAAVRSSRTIQKASVKERGEWGVIDDKGTYFFVERDKANLIHAGGREIYRTVPVPLGQGDEVAVVERFYPPDAFDGISGDDLLKVQRTIDGRDLRLSDQSPDWAGCEIASVLKLDAKGDRHRIKKLISIWIANGALRKETRKHNGRDTPVIGVGEWACE